MTSSELKLHEIKSRETIADKDRRQRHKSAQYAADAGIVGSGIRTLGGLASAMNDSSWYKKILGSTEANTVLSMFYRDNIPDGTLYEDETTSNRYVGYPAVFQINYAPTIGVTNVTVDDGTLRRDVVGGGINAALNRVATQLDKRNSRVSGYSRDTIGRYLFIATDVATDIIKLKMAIELFDKAQSKYPNLNRSLIMGLGFNYNNLKGDISAVKSRFTQLVADYNAGIALPRDLTYVARQFWVTSHILKDHKKGFPQFMVFCKAVKFEFAGDNYVSRPLGPNGIDAITLCDSISSRINTLVNGATWKPLLRDMRGGIDDKLFVQLDGSMTSTYVIESDMDEVLEQFHNMDIIPYYPIKAHTSAEAQYGLIFSSFSVGGTADEQVRQGVYFSDGNSQNTFNLSLEWRQTPGVVLLGAGNASTNLATLYKSVAANPSIGSPVHTIHRLNFYHEQVTPDDLLTATRFKHSYMLQDILVGQYAPGEQAMYLRCESGNGSVTTTITMSALIPEFCGTELILGIRPIELSYRAATVDAFCYDPNMVTAAWCVYDNAIAGNTTSNFVFTNYMSIDWFSQTSNEYSAFRCLHAFASCLQLDWIPIITFVGYDWDDGNYLSAQVIGELDNYSIIDDATLSRINRQCVESEFIIEDTKFLKPLS